jgi:hypothetical protein
MIMTNAQSNAGQWPAHGLALVGPGAGVSNFVSSTTSTKESNIPIAGTTLDRIDFLPSGQQAQAVQAAAAALPEGVLAHRLGDFVFTYHGIPAAAPDPALWIVVHSPDPDFNPPGGAAGLITVGLANGTVTSLAGPMSAALARQNALRAQYNLAPLPDPATVTHARAALASGDSRSEG